MRLLHSDSGIERTIIKGVASSDSLLKRSIGLLKKEHLTVGYLRTMLGWIYEYYKYYGKAPSTDVLTIFEDKKSDIKDDNEREFVEELISDIVEDTIVNEEYMYDRIREYVKKRNLILTVREVTDFVDRGRLSEAESRLEEYRKVSKQVTSWVAPLEDSKFVESVFDQQEGKVLFTMEGALGELIGPLKRGWFLGIMAPRKRGKCVSEDMLVPLVDGSVMTIGEIVKRKIKTPVLGLDEVNNEVKPVCVDQFWDNGEKECLVLTTRSGRRVEVTEGHLFLTPDGWKKIDSLHIGDYIAVPRKISFFGDSPMEENELKFLAYMLAEGSCTGSQPVFTNTDPVLVKDFEQTCKKLEILYKRRGISYLLKNALPLTRRLGLYGCSSKTKSIPDVLFRCPKEQIALFLRIFFSCDGSIFLENKRWKIELSLANERLLRQIGHLLTRFGIVYSLKYNQAKFNGKLFDSWRISIEDMENVNLFLEEINFLSRKYTKPFKVTSFRSFLDRIPWQKAAQLYEELERSYPDSVLVDIGVGKYIRKGKGFRDVFGEKHASSVREQIARKGSLMRQSFQKVKNNPICQKYLNGAVLWDEVKKIESIGRKRTYDLGISSVHNFIANDCFVHNSWFLQELAVEAMMNRRKVAFISLEMDSVDMAVRFYEEITTRGLEKGLYRFPVFDCVYNKEGSCTKPERVCSVSIDDDEVVRGDYKPCTACVGKEDSEYSFDVSFVEKERPRLTIKSVKNAIEKFRRMFGSKLYRQISLPAGIASLSDVEGKLDELESMDFIPDVIILDYADILKGTTTQEDLDRVWIRLKGMASKKNCLVVTVSQSNRASTDKFLLSQKDTSKDIGKIDQVDVMLTLNQTNEEKGRGIIRLGCIAHRWKKFDIYRQAYILQQLDLGSPMLDSLLLRVKEDQPPCPEGRSL